MVSSAIVGCGQPGDSGDPSADFNRSDLSIAVTGHDFQWEIVYPGRDGALGTADDLRSRRNLDVPAGATVTILLTSEDYIYMFELPELGLREMAAPELTFSVTFEPTEARTYELLGNQMCGYDHPDLLGTLSVHTPDEFNARMRRLETTS